MAAIKARSGRLDVLFANAGITARADRSVPKPTGNAVMDANLKGLYFTVQQALPLMGKGASIVLKCLGGRQQRRTRIHRSMRRSKRRCNRSASQPRRRARQPRYPVNVVSPGRSDTPIFAAMAMKARHSAVEKDWAAGNRMKRSGSRRGRARGAGSYAPRRQSKHHGAKLDGRRRPGELLGDVASRTPGQANADWPNAILAENGFVRGLGDGTCPSTASRIRGAGSVTSSRPSGGLCVLSANSTARDDLHGSPS